MFLSNNYIMKTIPQAEKNENVDFSCQSYLYFNDFIRNIISCLNRIFKRKDKINTYVRTIFNRTLRELLCKIIEKYEIIAKNIY